jgi:fumarate hydratase subunit beta
MVHRISCAAALSDGALSAVSAGDSVEISGELITIRDATAGRLQERVDGGSPLPVDLRGRLLYAVGPSPAQPGQVVGSAGPTTTERLARFLPSLFDAGAKGIIGKGELHGAIVDAFRARGAVYFAAVGGLGALLAKQIVAADVLAFAELGPEALFRFVVRDFPAVVIIDTEGRNFHETARAQWRRT